MLIIKPANHLHVDSGAERLARSVGTVCGQPVFDEFLNSRVVADDETIELPFASQYSGQRERIGGSRHTVEIVERTHESADSSIHRSLKWWKVDFAQRCF